MMDIATTNVSPPGDHAKPPNNPKLRALSQKLEATFLAEMLKSVGLGETSDALGGGPGEDQFQSFLLEAQATKMAEAGGIGLAEQIYLDLAKRYHDDGQ